jgi:hypothetical protein
VGDIHFLVDFVARNLNKLQKIVANQLTQALKDAQWKH